MISLISLIKQVNQLEHITASHHYPQPCLLVDEPGHSLAHPKYVLFSSTPHSKSSRGPTHDHHEVGLTLGCVEPVWHNRAGMLIHKHPLLTRTTANPTTQHQRAILFSWTPPSRNGEGVALFCWVMPNAVRKKHFVVKHRPASWCQRLILYHYESTEWK